MLAFVLFFLKGKILIVLPARTLTEKDYDGNISNFVINRRTGRKKKHKHKFSVSCKPGLPTIGRIWYPKLAYLLYRMDRPQPLLSYFLSPEHSTLHFAEWRLFLVYKHSELSEDDAGLERLCVPPLCLQH